MPEQGSVIVRVYTSDAFIPLPWVQVSFFQTKPDGTRSLCALRRTDRSGLTAPVFLEAPESSESLRPGVPERPYVTLDIQVQTPGYGGILVEGVQVFSGVETIQGFQLIPLPLSTAENSQTIFPGAAQNL